MFPRDGGMVPVMLQLNSIRTESDGMSPISGGMVPCTPHVAVHVHLTEADAAADVTRDDTGEHVLTEVNALGAPQGADAGRDISLKGVGAQVQ